MLPSWVPIVAVIVAAPLSLRAAAQAWVGEFRPNLVTWVLWALAPLIAAAAALTSGAGTSALPVFAAGAGPAVVVIAALGGPGRRRGVIWKARRRDYVCGAVAVAALVGWQVTGDALTAAVLAVAADALAGAPTVAKAWRHPVTETPWGYVAGIISGAVALATLTDWDPTNWLFPAYLIAICTLIVALIATPHRSSVRPLVEATRLIE